MTVSQELAKYVSQAQMSSFFIDKVGQIWVSAYGAVGDGVTDDTAAVQAAVTAATAAGVSEVNFVGGKTYKITALTGTTNITFLGNNVTITGGASITVNNYAEYFADYTALTGSKKLALVAAVIRNTGSGWEYIDNAAHTKLNFSTISVGSNLISLVYSVSVERVISVVVVSDETFAKSGIIPGASVSLTGVDILVTQEQSPIKGYISRSGGDFALALSENIDSISWDAGTTELTINHASNDGYDFSIYNRHATVMATISDQTGSSQNTVTKIKFIKAGAFVDPADSEVLLFFGKSEKRIQINPANLSSATGNFWVLGVVELN